MKIVLTSNIEALNSKNIGLLVGDSQKSIAVIPNAKDYYPKEIRDSKISESIKFMEDLGLNTTVVDLRHYFNSDSLRAVLEKFRVVWVLGGNTFHLMKAIQYSGFDTIIGDLLNHGLIYGGESAGAVVAGKSLFGYEKADSVEGLDNVTYLGLALVPFLVTPHVDSPIFSDAIKYVKKQNKNKYPVLDVKETQVIVYENGKIVNS